MLTRRVEQTCLLAGKGGGGTLPGLNCCLKVSPCHMGFPVVLNETQRRLRCVRFNWGLIGTGNGLGHLCYQSVHLPSTSLRSRGPLHERPFTIVLWMEHCVRVCVRSSKRLLKISKLISWNNLSSVRISLSLLLSFSLQPPLSKNIMESGPDIFSWQCKNQLCRFLM